MNLQEKYDELDTLITTLDRLIDSLDEIEMKDYIEQLLETKWEAQKELEEIEPKLQKIQWQEEQAQENEYWRAIV